MQFSLNQIYPCSKVELGSELFYICELGKYLQTHGHVLSLSGIVFSSDLKKSNYWNYLQVAYRNGWLVDMPNSFEESLTPVTLHLVKNIQIVEDYVPWSAEEDTRRKTDEEYNTYTPRKKQVIFSTKTDDVWEFSPCEEGAKNSVNIQSLKDDLISQSFVSLTAYVAVNRLLTGVPKSFLLAPQLDFLAITLSFADMTLLFEETNALNGWCFADTGEEARFSYEGWWFKYSDLGYMSRYYTPSEKKAEFKKLGFCKGDVVFLYKRDKCQVLNNIKSISSCNYAIIRDVNKEGLILDVFFTRNTRFGESLKFESYPKELQNMYFSDSYKNCRHSIKAIPWDTLGIEYMLYDEEFFISCIEKADNLVVQDCTEDLEEREFTLDCVNAIYWLLKDHEIDFDDEMYRKKHFKGVLPMWDAFKQGKLK